MIEDKETGGWGRNPGGLCEQNFRGVVLLYESEASPTLSLCKGLVVSDGLLEKY